ncbi:MAG: arylsulfotransferase family protein [Paracoccaceae bacterium]
MAQLQSSAKGRPVQKSRTFFILSGLFLLALGTFSLGMISVQKNWLPWQKAQEARDILRSLRKTGKILPNRSYAPRVPAASDVRYALHAPSAVAPGMLAITRLDPETMRYVTDLIAADGTVLHSWPIDYSRVNADGAALEMPHGVKVLPDGSLLVGFDGVRGQARLDACGEPLWARSDAVYHHVTAADTEGYWTWRAGIWDSGHDQALLRFDAKTGETLEIIDLIDEVILSDPANALSMAIPDGFVFDREAPENGVTDIFHPNDIEPLPAAMADAFPRFSPGDLLVSLRNLNLVAVLERRTHRFLWAKHGPWVRQHDPDWQADGTITVFNNNVDRLRSNIVRVDPETGRAEVLFAGGGPDFDSYIMGEHQRLENGNWLIVSAMEGRVIEVTAEGAPVREYSNIINKRYNAVIANAEHLPQGFFDRMPECGG